MGHGGITYQCIDEYIFLPLKCIPLIGLFLKSVPCVSPQIARLLSNDVTRQYLVVALHSFLMANSRPIFHNFNHFVISQYSCSKKLLMSGFEPSSSCVESDRSANCAKTSTHIFCFLKIKSIEKWLFNFAINEN